MADVSSTQQKIAAEVLGTFVLVFFGCGTAVISGGDYVATALAFGLTVLVMAYAVGRISGAHLNPAVSVGAGLSGRLAWPQVAAYMLAQLVGAVLAGALLLALMQGFDGYAVDEVGLGQNSFGDAGSGFAWWAAFLLEMLMTAIFLIVILAVTDGRNEHPALAPLTIGLALAMIHLASIGATGTSVNPARSIGVGLFAGSDAVVQLWLFILAPLLGGAIGGLAYPALFGRDTDPVPRSGLRLSRASRATPAWGTPDQYQQQWHQDASGGYAAAQAESVPIVQDGWQWDPVGQQWHPVGQTPEQWRAHQAAAQQAAGAGTAEQGTPEQGTPEQAAAQQSTTESLRDHQPWPEGDGDSQTRPPGQ